MNILKSNLRFVYIVFKAVAVCMEIGSFKEAEEVFERIFGDPEFYTVIICTKTIELILWLDMGWRKQKMEGGKESLT